MSNCKSAGGDKIKHPDRASAEQHLAEHQPHQTQLMQVYRCPNCGFWHIGRRGYTKKTRIFSEHIRNRNDEVLVGKLIGALKKVLAKQEVEK